MIFVQVATVLLFSICSKTDNSYSYIAIHYVGLQYRQVMGNCDC